MQNQEQNTNKNIKNLLIGVSGSVASIKLQQLIDQFLKSQKFNLKIVTTSNAKHFYNYEQLKQKYHQKVNFYEDSDQYQMWSKRGDPVLHIQLRKWADIFLVAPLSANTLAKFNSGISDNLISLIFRCWNMKLKYNKKLINPIILCPAMNNLMYDHPLTRQQLDRMDKFGCTIIDSIQKVLICGQKGKGAMQKVQKIISIVHQCSQNINIDNQK